MAKEEEGRHITLVAWVVADFKLIIMGNAEIGEVLPNGNVFVKIGKFDTIEIIDSNKVFTAQILAEVITDAINQLSVCVKCGKVSRTQNGLCYSCYQLSDGGTI